MEIARTEDQRAYQQALRRFCEREVAPHAVAVDRGEKSLWEAYRALGKAGMLATNLPEAYGGGGGDLTMMAICMTDISRNCSYTTLSFGDSLSQVPCTILRLRREEQLRQCLLPMYRR